MYNTKKVFFFAKLNDNRGIKFVSKDGDTMYRAGGNELQPKFIQQSLIDLYGKKEGIEIYNKYNKALLNIDNLDIDKQWNGPTATLVCYKKVEGEELLDE